MAYYFGVLPKGRKLPRLAFTRTPGLTLAFAQIESVPTNGWIATRTQRTSEIARELNVSTRTVQRWLSGKATPSEEKLKQIRKLLNKKRLNL